MILGALFFLLYHFCYQCLEFELCLAVLSLSPGMVGNGSGHGWQKRIASNSIQIFSLMERNRLLCRKYWDSQSVVVVLQQKYCKRQVKGLTSGGGGGFFNFLCYLRVKICLGRWVREVNLILSVVLVRGPLSSKMSCYQVKPEVGVLQARLRSCTVHLHLIFPIIRTTEQSFRCPSGSYRDEIPNVRTRSH